MNDKEWLAQRFEANRTHLRSVAYRMLGSPTEADDAVQEAWLRLSRSDASGVENLGGWLTTVVGRVCLDVLRSRRSRREEPLSGEDSELLPETEEAAGPEDQALMADSVGLALLVVLERLTPAERVAFVLHDMFDLPFDQIGAIVGRSPAAARQLASRARRRVQGAEALSDPDVERQRRVVDAFLAASRAGDFQALLAVLDPDVVLRADAEAVRMGADEEVRGAGAVAETFAGRARAAQPALVDGSVGLVWAHGGQTRVVFALTFEGERITGVELLADPDRLGGLDVTVLD